MSKFHINKHGVPAPCKATKGNCPLGGNEQHFNSEEEAQAFIDNQMESKHGLLGRTPSVPAVKNVTINHDINEMFLDSWIERGIQATGIYSDDLKDAFDYGPRENEEPWEKGYRDLYEAIKDDADRIAKENGNPDFALIPEKNMKSHMENNVLFPGEIRSYEKPEDGWVTYDKLKESAIKHFGRDAIDRETYIDKDMYFNEELRDELAEFGAKRMKEDAQFNVNGQSVYFESSAIGTGLYDIDWVDEYAKAVKNGTEKSKFKVISED